MLAVLEFDDELLPQPASSRATATNAIVMRGLTGAEPLKRPFTGGGLVKRSFTGRNGSWW